MIRPFCIKELHTRCRHTTSDCECICHKDNGSGIPIDNGKPSPLLERIYELLTEK